MTDREWLKLSMKWAVTWLAIMALALFVCAKLARAASGEERRQARALFRQVEGCVETTSLVLVDENTATVLELYPDGWARYATVTIESNDTCNGLQLLNASGQIQVQAADLAVDRKLEGAKATAWITVWDGISRSEGRIYVVATWKGIGPVSRSVWRTVSRGAEAILTVDGMVQLRNATTDAVITITK